MKINFNLSSQLGNTQPLCLLNMFKCFNLMLKCSLSRYVRNYHFSFNQAVCVENSCMVRGSKEGRNGFIHVFRQIIKPAEKSLHEMLRNDKRFRWVASWQRWGLSTDCGKIYSTARLRNSYEPWVTRYLGCKEGRKEVITSLKTVPYFKIGKRGARG